MNTFNDFLNESKITLKRQYTNNHPAITVGKTASIRNRMLEAIKDGKLTQEEFTAILKEASVDSNRWMKRNARFFSITEDGVTLTKIGNRTLAAITVNESVVNEKVKETTEAEGRNWKVGTLDHPKFGKITTFKFMTNDNVWIQLSTRQPLEDQDNFMIADGGSAYNTSWSLNDKNVKKMAKDLQELSLRLQNDSFMNLGKSGEGKYKGKEVKLKDYVDAVEAWVELKDSLLSESVVTEGNQPHKEIEKAIKGMKGVSMDIKGDTIIVSNKAGDEFTYSMNDADDVADFITTIEESVVTEAEIKTEDDFKEYAYGILKKAFADDFDQAKADDVVNGILSKSNGDFGKAAGILQSSLA